MICIKRLQSYSIIPSLRSPSLVEASTPSEIFLIHHSDHTYRFVVLWCALRALPARVGAARVRLDVRRLDDDEGSGQPESGRGPGREDEPGLGGGSQGDEAKLISNEIKLRTNVVDVGLLIDTANQNQAGK